MSAFTSFTRLLGTIFIGAALLAAPVVRAATATVAAGSPVTLKVTNSGTAPFSYQWRKDGVNISGATSANYTIASAASTHAGVYTVVVSNSMGSTVSDNGTLAVSATLVAPAFTTQPASQTVTTGASVTFTAAASGTPSPTYQWRVNGTNISGATSASYTIANVTSANAATYSVVATNSAGSVTSNGAVLTVNTSGASPVFTTQPVSQAVTVGAAVTFTATASGTPSPTYQWRKDGVNISGATSVSCVISSTTSYSAGVYSVVATNSAGSVTSNGAVLTVNGAAVAPAFTTQPSSRTVTAGASVTFTAAASGSPTPTFQWRKNGTNISGATSASYTISGTTTSSAGTYTVVATNSAGSATSNSAVLTVNAAAVAPGITTQPTSKTVTAGASVTFTVAASGTPAPTYQWRFNGTNIAGATSSSYTIASVAAANAGSYSVVALNSAGSVTSSTATLTVNAAPVFTTQPVNKSATVGSSVTLTAAASGSPSPTYQWRKNGTNISGATSASYTISSVSTSSAATYTVVATNSVGSTTSTGAVLTVTSTNVAPSITSQPVAQTSAVGGSVTFSVAATGTPTPTYQWKKNGADIAGATAATYSIATVTAADAGNYWVVVSNTAGSVTSSGAILTVNSVPVITTQPASQTVTAGNAASLTVVATGSPAPTYQWRKNGTNVAGATGATYTIASSTVDNAGTYTVVVSNTAGSVTSAAAVLTVNVDTKPVITQQPPSQTVVTGSTVTFKVVATGSGTLTYQWRKNGANISGATSASYSLTNLKTSNSGSSYSVVITNAAGSVTSDAAVLTVKSSKASLAVRVDFNGDGQSDILWQDLDTGKIRIDLMAGTTVGSSTTLDAGGTAWVLGGTGDYNADGRTDILWENVSTGAHRIWLMAGTSISSTVSLGSPGAAWAIAGGGDFNLDGKSDILWQNLSTAERRVWLMNGTSLSSDLSLGTGTTAWTIAGAGDFNGDGRSDIMWQNLTTGVRNVWLMDSSTDGPHDTFGTVSPEWEIVGTGDFDGDYASDIIWQNAITGERAIWLMNGLTMKRSVPLATAPLNWVIKN